MQVVHLKKKKHQLRKYRYRNKDAFTDFCHLELKLIVDTWKSKWLGIETIIRNNGPTTADMETCKAAGISSEVALKPFV